MNSFRALVTAAFLVRSPLTAKARSISFGSMDRLIVMCESPHMSLHQSVRPQRTLPVRVKGASSSQKPSLSPERASTPPIGGAIVGRSIPRAELSDDTSAPRGCAVLRELFVVLVDAKLK